MQFSADAFKRFGMIHVRICFGGHKVGQLRLTPEQYALWRNQWVMPLIERMTKRSLKLRRERE